MQAVRDFFFSSRRTKDAAAEDTSTPQPPPIRTKPCDFLRHAQLIDMEVEPATQGFFTVAPSEVTSNSPPETETHSMDGVCRSAKDSTPKKRSHVPKYDVDEDGKVLGMIWPYTESAFRRRTRRPVPRQVDYFSMDTTKIHGFPPEEPKNEACHVAHVFRDESEAILFREKERNVNDEESGNGDASEDLKEWYRHVDPEMYAKACTVYSMELVDPSLANGSEGHGSKRRRLNKAQSEDGGVLLNAIHTSKAVWSYWFN